MEQEQREAKDVLRDAILSLWKACRIYADALRADRNAATAFRREFPDIPASLWEEFGRVGRGAGDMRALLARPDFRRLLAVRCGTCVSASNVLRMLDDATFVDSVVNARGE
jgi:hypothetical protein